MMYTIYNHKSGIFDINNSYAIEYLFIDFRHQDRHCHGSEIHFFQGKVLLIAFWSCSCAVVVSVSCFGLFIYTSFCS